jgi:hypothetical protein
MACNLTRPEPQILHDRLRDMFSANVLGGAPVIPESNEDYVVKNDYAAAEMFYSIAEQQWRETDPRYACCDNLVKIAARDGVYPRPSTFARGHVVLTGVAGSRMIPDIRVEFGGQIYRVADPKSIPDRMPASGSLSLIFVAQTPGEEGNNLQLATAGRLITPITGIDQRVTVGGGHFCLGTEPEDCEAFRRRYLERLKHKPDLRFKSLELAALEFPCLTRICIRDCCNEVACGCGPRHINIFAMFDNTYEAGIAPPEIVSEVDAFLFGSPKGWGMGKAPVGVCGTVFPATAGYVDLTFSGFACSTPSQREEVDKRVRALFATICPGKEVCQRLIITAAAQIVPDICDFEVTALTDSPGIEISPCGDIVPECDFLPVIRSITFV